MFILSTEAYSRANHRWTTLHAQVEQLLLVNSAGPVQRVHIDKVTRLAFHLPIAFLLQDHVPNGHVPGLRNIDRLYFSNKNIPHFQHVELRFQLKKYF